MKQDEYTAQEREQLLDSSNTHMCIVCYDEAVTSANLACQYCAEDFSKTVVALLIEKQNHAETRHQAAALLNNNNSETRAAMRKNLDERREELRDIKEKTFQAISRETKQAVEDNDSKNKRV